MRLKVYNSNSSGNCYLLYNDEEALLLECGYKFRQVVQDLGNRIKNVSGCLISHEHGDHAKYVSDVLKYRIPCYMSEGTKKSLFGSYNNELVRILAAYGEPETIGRFKVIAFNTEHDCEEPFGYLVWHPEMGNLIFATDTYYLRNRFTGVSHMMVECNYEQSILDKNVMCGKITKAQRDRTIKSHMSLDTCRKAIEVNDNPRLRNVILIHLSDSNSNERMFVETISSLVRADVFAAKSGLDISINKEPF